MDCLIYQPVGLGDILWVQPIVDTYIENGYEVWYPVEDIYLSLMQKYMPKEGLHWVHPDDNYPMKNRYGAFDKHESASEVYMPLSYADRYFPEASTMLAKYYLAKHSLTNWHLHTPIVRDLDRELALQSKYQLDNNAVIVNQNYGTFPEYITHNLPVEGDPEAIHYMNIEQDIANGFNAFDWINAFMFAREVHTVETSTCYFVDKYCRDKSIHMYERRRDSDSLAFYSKTNKVYRNPDWEYHVW